MISTPPRPENRQLCLFAKHWVAGTVKTRLGADIGMQQAANLHQAFVRRLIVALHPTPSAPGIVTPLLATSPDSAIEQVAEICKSWQICGQGQGDLGQRMQRMFETHLGENLRLVVIGADCPDLPLTAVEDAWQRLTHTDVVLGPASDGGYYLLGLSGPWQPWMSTLFNDVRWSQADVADTTRQRIADAGRSVAELAIRDDVDTLADLQRLIQRLAMHADQQLLADIAAIVPQQVTPSHRRRGRS